MTLVGRDAELARLQARLDALADRSGGVVLLEGEPGIGKTSLLDWVAEHAAGCSVVAAHASIAEEDLPYSLWRAALEPRLDELGERGVERLGLADAPALAAVVPSIAGAEPADAHRINAALRDALTRLAGPRPLVCCLDDVHRADPASAAALAALIHRPPGGGVLLVLAARSGRLARPLALAVDHAVARERLERIEPAPLTLKDAAALGVGADVYERAGGNPFFLRQLARTRGAIPETVAASLAAELSERSPAALLLVRAGAILGEPFELDLAAAVAPLESGAHDAIDELVANGLLRATKDPRAFAFRHPLVAGAVEAASPPGARLAAHARGGR